ncbi:MAG: hypothetical protein KME09_09090 [Pleurocapsa minor HA4230-MV1]|nr:hypothetical protein [Pleurocapsa minor HA4230-MV1]
MIADSKILHLPKVSLETKELLPEYSGIYYVVDENKIVWYVGKAQNIRKRWQGKAHHRIYQLKQLKHKYFDIYYENISLSQLDLREKQQITKCSFEFIRSSSELRLDNTTGLSQVFATEPNFYISQMCVSLVDAFNFSTANFSHHATIPSKLLKL